MHSSRKLTNHQLTVSGGSAFQGVCLMRRGLSSEWLGWGVYLPHGICGKADPPVNRMTHMCKNITVLQFGFRAVAIIFHFFTLNVCSRLVVVPQLSTLRLSSVNLYTICQYKLFILLPTKLR